MHLPHPTPRHHRHLQEHRVGNWALYGVGTMPRKSGLKFSVKGARICQGASARVPVLNVPLGSPLNDSKPAFACVTVRVPHAAHLVKKALAEEHLGRLLTWVALSRAEPVGSPESQCSSRPEVWQRATFVPLDDKTTGLASAHALRSMLMSTKGQAWCKDTGSSKTNSRATWSSHSTEEEIKVGSSIKNVCWHF